MFLHLCLVLYIQYFASSALVLSKGGVYPGSGQGILLSGWNKIVDLLFLFLNIFIFLFWGVLLNVCHTSVQSYKVDKVCFSPPPELKPCSEPSWSHFRIMAIASGLKSSFLVSALLPACSHQVILLHRDKYPFLPTPLSAWSGSCLISSNSKVLTTYLLSCLSSHISHPSTRPLAALASWLCHTVCSAWVLFPKPASGPLNFHPLHFLFFLPASFFLHKIYNCQTHNLFFHLFPDNLPPTRIQNAQGQDFGQFG